MMGDNTDRRVALVILEDGDGRIAMQLRDDLATIRKPNQWGLFGGQIEEGERPFQAALREIKEELTIKLDHARLTPLCKFRIVPGKEHHLFHYLITDELDAAVLQEGQLYKQLSREEIKQGRMDGRLIVAHHLEMLNWFWRNGMVDHA